MEWKMSFNPDPSKQAQFNFSRKLKKVPYPPLVFNNANVYQCKSQKHLGITLDSKLTFKDQYKTVLSKTNKSIGLLRKLENLPPREALIIIYKPLLDLISITLIFSLIKHLTLHLMKS